MGTKPITYSTIQDEIPSVNEPTGMYLYLQKNPVNTTFVALLDELIELKDTLVSQWLNITPKTYRSYKNKGARIKHNTKEHMVSILSLYKHGIEVFNSKTDFETWLTTKNLLLDNKEPASFLDTISGIRFIDNRLTAIEYGENA